MVDAEVAEVVEGKEWLDNVHQLSFEESVHDSSSRRAATRRPAHNGACSGHRKTGDGPVSSRNGTETLDGALCQHRSQLAVLVARNAHPVDRWKS